MVQPRLRFAGRPRSAPFGMLHERYRLCRFGRPFGLVQPRPGRDVEPRLHADRRHLQRIPRLVRRDPSGPARRCAGGHRPGRLSLDRGRRPLGASALADGRPAHPADRPVASRSRGDLRRHAPGAGLALGRRRADLGSLRHGQRRGMRVHQHAAGDVDPFRSARSRHDLGHRRDRRHLRQPRRRRDLGEMQRRAEKPGHPQSRLLRRR